MQVFLEIQNIISSDAIPSEKQMLHWITLALSEAGFQQEFVEMTIRVVSQEESQQLNFDYRNKNQPTNILSFPFEAPAQIACDLLGDLVICQQVVENEAEQQSKVLFEHWAHMLIHGTLHLLGLDHITDEDAEEMETLEILILEKLNISNPYLN